MMDHVKSVPTHVLVMEGKHNAQMIAHQAAHGPLGELQNPPTQEQLDEDFEKRRAEGTLFTQMPKDEE